MDIGETLSRPIDVLLIEGNKVDARLFAELMDSSEAQINLVVKDKGEAGIEHLMQVASTEERPDMIVSDLKLPGMNGFDILDIIKRENTMKMIPVVITPSSDDDLDSSQVL